MVSNGSRARRVTAMSFGVLLTTACAVGGVVDESSATAARPARRVGPWSLVIPGRAHVPVPGGSSGLNAVSCVSSSSCWAVGGYFNGAGDVNEALHWNGTKWSLVATPNPAGTTAGSNNTLFGVRCNASNDCWAVGDEAHGVEMNEALHWNGTKWAAVTTPNPAGTSPGDFNNLADVTCTSAGNCWAVGEYGTLGILGETILNSALHWNGTKWSQVSTPNPGGTGLNDANSLESVRCTSAGNCWAVGTYGFVGSPTTLLNEALHWNGSAWSQITTPNPDGTGANAVNFLSGLACTAASDCWATGAYGSEGATTTLLNQALHWDGAQWSLVNTPDPDGTGTGAQNQLHAITCVSTHNCWTVGTYGFIDNSGQGVVVNEALHWNGTTWVLVNTPDPGGLSNGDANQLRGVRCTSTSNCWAVGDAQSNGANDHNQALHWNGAHWSAA